MIPEMHIRGPKQVLRPFGDSLPATGGSGEASAPLGDPEPCCHREPTGAHMTQDGHLVASPSLGVAKG